MLLSIHTQLLHTAILISYKVQELYLTNICVGPIIVTTVRIKNNVVASDAAVRPTLRSQRGGPVADSVDVIVVDIAAAVRQAADPVGTGVER